jgi:serine phosphatase RsbU (regulator of sigma subunit)/PAS domain-containing protein
MEDHPRSTWIPANARIQSSLWIAIVPALIALAGLAILDTRADPVIIGFYALIPFTTALSGNLKVTAAIAVMTVVVAGLSGIWDDNYDEAGYWIRYALVAVASLFACYVAAMIGRSNRTIGRIELLNAIASGTGSRETLAATLKRITELVVPDFADICMIDSVAGERLERIAVRAAGPRRAEIESGLLSRRPSISPEVAFGDGAGDPALNRHVSDADLRTLAQSNADLEFLRSLGARSYISVALRSRDRRIGALTIIQASSGRRYDEDDVRFYEVVADRFALILDNAGLFSDLESVEMRMDTAMGVLDEPVTITERGGRLIYANQAAAELAGRSTPAELLDADADTTGYDIYDESGVLIGAGKLPWQLEDAAGGDIVRLVEARHGEEAWLRIRSAPIPAAGGRTIFTVTAFEDVSEMKYAEFAQLVFTNTAELLSASTDPGEMIERLVRLLIPRLGDACGILVPDPEGALRLAALADVDRDREAGMRELIGANRLDPDGAGMPELLSAREPIVCDAAVPEQWPGAALDIAAGMSGRGLGAVMAQPLRVGPRLIGIIGFANHVGRRPFTALEQRVALRISERIALAIDNVRIASERSEIAATLQRGLRPPVIPDIPGWSTAALYNPAGAENRAGGDFYDALPIDDGWMVLIGDVTGHGAEAAALTALARHTLRTAVTITGDPLRALAALNDALLARADSSLCTVALMVLDQPARGSVRVAVAGHPPPLHVHDGASREVSPAGPVLGAFEDAGWEIETVALDPGDQLLAYTDGVVEAPGRDGRFGADRLRRCIGEVDGPNEAIGMIRSELERFAARGLDDDAAVVALRLDDSEGSAEPVMAANRQFRARERG